MTTYIVYTLIVFILSFYFKKKNYFLSMNTSEHQKFANSKIPLIGGFFLLIPLLIYLHKDYLFFLSILSLIFLLGVFSDLNILSSPKKRFFLQCLLILFFVFVKQIEVLPSRINYIDENFINTYWSYFFTAFCLMILINGSNFIDGLNGLLLGYLLIILFIVYKLNLFSYINLSEEKFIFLIFTFVIVFIFNLFNQFFLGDSGAYSLSLFIGFILIKIYNANIGFSPYFIILLLWYPCFENLFSILRKLFKSKSALKPDNEHLHQFIFLFLKKKFNLKNLNANILSGFSINLFNLSFISLSLIDPQNTKFQLLLISFCLFFYILVYALVRNFLKKY